MKDGDPTLNKGNGKIHSPCIKKKEEFGEPTNAPVENMVLRFSSLPPRPLPVWRLDGFPSPEPPDYRRLTFFDEGAGCAFRELHRDAHERKRMG